MKKLITFTISTLALSLFLVTPYLSTYAVTGEQKTMCSNLIRHGKEELQRKKFSQAKKFFREAIQVDPANKTAWKYYDQAVIFALAAQVRVDDSLTRIDSEPSSVPKAAQPAEESKDDTVTDKPSSEKDGDEEEEEEGC